MRTPWLLAFTALAASPSALALSVATVAIHDEGKRGQGEAIRGAVQRGLEGGGFTVISPGDLEKEARLQGFGNTDLIRPAVLMPVAQAAGADGVLQGTLLRKGQQLQIRVFDLQGVELWSRTIPLNRGALPADIPGKIARAVAAAMTAAGITGSGPPPAPTPVAAPTTPTRPVGATPKPATPPTDEEEGEEKTASSSRPVQRAQPSAEQKSEGEELAGPQEKKPESPPPAPPYIDLGLGFTLTSRSYQVCPGVTDCSQPSPSGAGVPVKYSTQTPYGGLSISGEVFPFPHLVQVSPAVTLTFGVAGEFSRSLTLVSNYTDPTSGAPGSFGSTEDRIEGYALGRFYYNLLGGVGYVGAQGGAMHRFFNVDPNPLLNESKRTGPAFGVNGEVPLWQDYVKLQAQLVWSPAADPSVPETTQYGQTGSGSGFDVRGGLTGGYGYIGYSVIAAYTSFSDNYQGPGLATANGAVALESYTTFYFLIRGRY